MGTVILALLCVAAAIGAAVYLVRGIVMFLKATEDDLKSGSAGPSQSSLKQNRMMMGRIMMQALAILIVAVLLLMGSGK